MKARVDYFSASGVHHEAAAFLAHRYDPEVGFQRLESESIVVVTAPGPSNSGKTHLIVPLKSTGWFVQLWRSVEGTVYVAESFGEVSRSRQSDLGAPRVNWAKTELDAGLDGIWGLSDELVFAWGWRDKKPALFMFDGQRWTEIKAPSFRVNGMHGTSRNAIWACGVGGKVAQWTGNSWQELVIPGGEDLICVHVAQENELYAVGSTGSLFEGSPFGWGHIGRIPDALPGDVQAVAKFAGELWVGASRLGLWKRKNKSNDYECIKPNIPAVSLDTRGEFVIGAQTALIWSTDGNAFKGTGAKYIDELRGDAAFGDF